MGDNGKKHGLQKELGLLELFCIASGAMISSGLFILPGIAFSQTGPALLLSYVVASLLVIPPMLSKAELATAMPKAGGTYFFIDRSMGPLMGTIGGFASWFSLAFKSAFALVGIGVFALLLNPGFTELQMKLIAVFFCIVFTIINIYGVKHSGKIQIYMVLGLLSLLFVYIITGLFYVQPMNFNNFLPFGVGSIFSTAGLIFVSFGGLTKICSVSEECKKPGYSIPRAMFLSWFIISIVYILVIFITIGVSNPSDLMHTLTPISLGANSIPLLGGVGAAVMAIAAILSFVTTANSGLLAASRNPMAMGKDRLIPHNFAYISKRGTPTFSIIFTAAFMILVILFLDLESLVKTASLLKILLFLFVILSLIIMRESKIRHYRPVFKSPLYPWLHIVGISGLIFLIIEMGALPMILVCVFILIGFLWYWFYARDKIWREFSLLHVRERITGEKTTTHMTDGELRDILICRDDIDEQRFTKLLNKCPILDLYKYLAPQKLFKSVAKELESRLHLSQKQIYKLLKKRTEESNVVITPGTAIFSHYIKNRNTFEILAVRTRKGLMISKDIDPIHNCFIIVASPDQESYHMHSIMWLTKITEHPDFHKNWMMAQSIQDLRKILLDAWESQCKK